MEITERSTGKRLLVVVSEVRDEDFKELTKKRFFFHWKSLKDLLRIFKLQVKGSEAIIGAIGVLDWPTEARLEIKLLASSAENVGKEKEFEGIAGCLIAYVCRMAILKYGPAACVSLLPKTELITHYKEKYKMATAGRQLYLEGKNLINLIHQYDVI